MCLEKLVGNPEGQGLKRLGSGEIERPSPVQGPQHHVDLIGELCACDVKTTQAEF